MSQPAKFVLIQHDPTVGWWYVGDIRGPVEDTPQVIGTIFDNFNFVAGDTCPDLTANDLRELAGLLDTIEKGVAP